MQKGLRARISTCCPRRKIQKLTSRASCVLSKTHLTRLVRPIHAQGVIRVNPRNPRYGFFGPPRPELDLMPASNTQRLRPEIHHQSPDQRSVQVIRAENALAPRTRAPLHEIEALPA